jgi:lipopolysaccharide core heptose(I) kinase
VKLDPPVSCHPKAGIHVEYLDEGRLLASTDYLPTLNANGLNTFESIMSYDGGEIVRSVPGRFTVKISLSRPEGGTQVAFLKRYRPEYLSPGRKLLRFLGWPGAEDEAMREWRAISELRKNGFSAPVPIAFGRRREFGITVESFLMTAEISGGTQADFYCRELKPLERRALALEIADFSQRFHEAGFVHKDFYLCHIFVVVKNGTRELFLIDLQRLSRPQLFRRRWLVKDLGALAYSGFKFGASRKDLMSFYKRYRGVKKLRPEDKSLVGKVLARVKRMTRHRPKYDADFEQLKAW